MAIAAQYEPARSSRQWRSDLFVVALLLVMLALWDLSGLDLLIERLFGSASGFPLRESRVAIGFYDFGRLSAWILVPLMVAGLWVRVPVLERARRPQRVWWLLTTVACLVLIPFLRSRSATSCPWSLTEFGGTVPYMSHWWRQVDAGPGKCFPSGHASTGFAFFAGYFALRGSDRRLANRWLAGALALGLMAAVVQSTRGAHFFSHSLWTAGICWTTTATLWHLTRWGTSLGAARTRRRSPAAPFIESPLRGGVG